MARFKGIDIPNNKRVEIALTYIYGIGRNLSKTILKEGMVIAVEPMLNLGTRQVFMLDDDWTIVTGDNKPSAHFEHTVVVTKDGYQILTGDDKYE